MNLDTNIIAELAQEMESTDPVDWDMLPIKEEDAYKMMATYILEIVNKTPEHDRTPILAAIATKMLVENFVLNSRDVIAGIQK